MSETHYSRSSCWLASLLSLVIPAVVVAQGEVHETVISEDVIAIRGLVANMVAVRTDDGLVLVDSLISPLHARMARARISEHFPNQPVRYVINTHYHPDHNLGNQEFPRATIIAHTHHLNRFPGALEFPETMVQAPTELARIVEQLESSETAPNSETLGQLKLWHKRLARYSGFQPRTADLRLDGSATLSLGGKTIKILHFGAGHTDGDLAVLFEEDRVLATGDLVFRDIVPVIDREGGVDIEGWIRALHHLSDLGDGVEHVVPGHGDAGGPAILEEQARYLDDLWQSVSQARAGGQTLAEAQAATALKRYADYSPLFNDTDGNVEECWQLLDQ